MFSVSSGIGNAAFTNTSSGSNLVHSWSFGDGFTSTDTNPTHSYMLTGTYVVCLTITSIDSLSPCTSTYCDSIYISTDSTTAGISSVELTNFTLFPNPAQNVVNIHFDETFHGEVQVADIIGRVMTNQVVDGNNAKLNISLPIRSLSD